MTCEDLHLFSSTATRSLAPALNSGSPSLETSWRCCEQTGWYRQKERSPSQPTLLDFEYARVVVQTNLARRHSIPYTTGPTNRSICRGLHAGRCRRLRVGNRFPIRFHTSASYGPHPTKLPTL